MPPIYAINMDSTSEVEPSDDDEPDPYYPGEAEDPGDEAEARRDEIDAQILDTRELLEEHEKKIEDLSALLQAAVEQRDQQQELLNKLQVDRAALDRELAGSVSSGLSDHEESMVEPVKLKEKRVKVQKEKKPDTTKFVKRFVGAAVKRRLPKIQQKQKEAIAKQSLLVKLPYPKRKANGDLEVELESPKQGRYALRQQAGSKTVAGAYESMSDDVSESMSEITEELIELTPVQKLVKKVATPVTERLTREELDPRYHPLAIQEVNGDFMVPHSCKPCTILRQFCDRNPSGCTRCEERKVPCDRLEGLSLARRRITKGGNKRLKISSAHEDDKNKSVAHDNFDLIVDETMEDAEILSASDDSVPEFLGRIFKCPMIGCENTDYESEAALKYHREHAHRDDQLITSASAALSTPSRDLSMVSDGKSGLGWPVIGYNNKTYKESMALEDDTVQQHPCLKLETWVPGPPTMAPTPDSQETLSAVPTEAVLDPNPLQGLSSKSSPRPSSVSAVSRNKAKKHEFDERYHNSALRDVNGVWKVPYLCIECKNLRRFCDRKRPTCTHCETRGKACIPVKEGLQSARTRVIKPSLQRKKLVVSLKVNNLGKAVNERAMASSTMTQSPFQDMVPDSQDQDWTSVYYENLPFAEDSLLGSAVTWLTNESTG